MSAFSFLGKHSFIKINDKPEHVFLSHNSKDTIYGDVLKGLLNGVGLENDRLIYTSNEDNGVPFGRNIYDYLQERLESNPIVMFLLSADYFSSIVCMNELGASWVRKYDYYSFYIPGFNLKNDNFLNSCIDSNIKGVFLNGDDKCRVGLQSFIKAVIANFGLICDDYRMGSEIEKACKKFRNISVIGKEFTARITDVTQKTNYTFCKLDILLPIDKGFHKGESHWLQFSREYNKDVIDLIEIGKSVTFIPKQINPFNEAAYGQENFRNIYMESSNIRIF